MWVSSLLANAYFPVFSVGLAHGHHPSIANGDVADPEAGRHIYIKLP